MNNRETVGLPQDARNPESQNEERQCQGETHQSRRRGVPADRRQGGFSCRASNGCRLAHIDATITGPPGGNSKGPGITEAFDAYPWQTLT
jgi:hypothetical protein